jgi:rare lipoprotein A
MAKQLSLSNIITLLLVTLTLTACGSSSKHKIDTPVESRNTGAYLAGDGPGENVPTPADLDAIPNAVPKLEPLHRYANRPYEALGKTYIPQISTGNFTETGMASWYGKKFHGEPTSSGEIYDMYAMTAAHPTLPIPSYVRVTRTESGKSVIVKINDRGPFLHNRVIDLSYTAAYKLDIINAGSAEVTIEGLPATSIVAATKPKPVIAVVPVAAPVIAPRAAITTPAASFIAPVIPIRPTAAAHGNRIQSNIYLQLGAFSTQTAAENFLVEAIKLIGISGTPYMLFSKAGLTRVHIGPYASQAEARNDAKALAQRLGFDPILNLH